MSLQENPMGDSFESMSKEQLLAVLKTLLKRGTQDASIGQVVGLYLSFMDGRVERKEITPDYLKNVKRDLERFARVNGSKLVRECAQHMLTNFIRNNPEWKSGHKQYSVSGHICTCLAWAKEEGLIGENPFRRVKVRVHKRSRRPCTAQEYVALMKFANRALRRILLFLRRTGARTSEARALRWQDVRLDDENPHVVLATHKSYFKTGKPRFFGLDAGTAGFLAALKRQAPPGIENVFFNTNGAPWTRLSLALAFRRTRAYAGLPDDIEHRFSAYSLRHLYCVSAIKAGMSTRMIADQLGHSSTAMVDGVYGSSTRSDLPHLGKVANEAINARLRERPRPIVPEKPLDLPPASQETGRLSAVFFGDKLRGLRLNAGLSQSQLGEKIGLAVGKIKEFESGRVRPTLETVALIAHVLGVNSNFFADERKDGAS